MQLVVVLALAERQVVQDAGHAAVTGTQVVLRFISSFRTAERRLEVGTQP